MEEVSRVVFMKEPSSLEALIEGTWDIPPEGMKSKYKTVVVVKDIKVNDHQYEELTEDLQQGVDWIKKEDSGYINGKEKVIRVTDDRDGEFFVRSEGYDYIRYAGIRY